MIKEYETHKLFKHNDKHNDASKPLNSCWFTETVMSSYWWHFCYRLHQKAASDAASDSNFVNMTAFQSNVCVATDTVNSVYCWKRVMDVALLNDAFRYKYHGQICTKAKVVFTKHLPHDDVIKWKHFPRYLPFVRGIPRSPVNSSHKGQWHGALMFSFICAWINGCVNNRQAGDLRRHRAHYDVTVMLAAYSIFQLCAVSQLCFWQAIFRKSHNCTNNLYHYENTSRDLNERVNVLFDCMN